MTIELSKNQVKKFEEWKKTFYIGKKESKRLPNIGAMGGHFGLSIIYTSIGTVIKGVAWNGQEIDLTEYENF